jgi:hypothetical protein
MFIIRRAGAKVDLSFVFGESLVRRGQRRAFGLAAVAAGFFGLFPGIFLDGSEGALEKGVVDDIGFTVFAANDPVAALDVGEAEVGGNGGGLGGLGGVDQQGPAGTKCAHMFLEFLRRATWPGSSDWIAMGVRRRQGRCKGVVNVGGMLQVLDAVRALHG